MFSFMKKKLDWSSRMLLIVVVVAVLARIIYALRPAVPWWDETIYIGMAKWVFSGGTLGYWESFRPVVLPFLLGFGWKAGMGIIAWGKFLEIVASLGIIVLTYRIGEKMYKHAGLIAASMMALLPVFFSYGNKLLTGIPATFFSLLALWLLINKRWYWVGLCVGLAFLTRFILAFTALALALAVIVSWLTGKQTWKRSTISDVARMVAKMIVGFFTVVIPYLVSNLFLYGDAFYPIKEGSKVFTQYNNWLYVGGKLFYTNTVIAQNALLVFSVLGLIAFVYLKKWKSDLWVFSMAAMIFPMIYFGVVAHKEARFFIPVFPFIALFTGIGISWMLATAQKKWRKFSQRKAAVVITLITIFSLVTGSIAIAYMIPEGDLQGDQYTYYHYFDNASMSDDFFIATNPLFIVYTDKPITFLRSWELAEEVWTRYGAQASHVAIDLCDYPCEPGTMCETWRADFLESMKTRGTKVFDGVYEQWDGQSCELFIWTVNKE